MNTSFSSVEKNGSGRVWYALVQDPDAAAIAALRRRPDLTDIEDETVSLEEVYAGLMAKPAGPSVNGTLPPLVRRVPE